MRLFGSGSAANEAELRAAQEEVIAKLDSALTAVFSADGKTTVLFYMTTKYGVTLEEASLDPARLERALTSLLGQVGWMVVKKAILEQFWQKKIAVQEIKVVETASLREAFGFVKGFTSLMPFKPI